MAVPKRNHSNKRTAQRRAHWKIEAKGLKTCPNCGAKMLPHRACAACGYYKGKQVLDVKEAK